METKHITGPRRPVRDLAVACEREGPVVALAWGLPCLPYTLTGCCGTMWRLDIGGPGPRQGASCREGIATIQERDAGDLGLPTLSRFQALSMPSVVLSCPIPPGKGITGERVPLYSLSGGLQLRPFSPRLPAVD